MLLAEMIKLYLSYIIEVNKIQKNFANSNKNEVCVLTIKAGIHMRTKSCVNLWKVKTIWVLNNMLH